MEVAKVSKRSKRINGQFTLTGSKSICNRALIIRAFSKKDFPINGIAAAEDSQTLIRLLDSTSDIYDVGHAGTTYRFMTAYLALQQGTQVLTGSDRMKQRPIGILVDALNCLGANIEYMEKEGFPPLTIHSPKSTFGQTNQLKISAAVSSQYISALLMAGPTLPNGLILTLEGKIVSRPYIRMTLNVMLYFGIQYDWTDNVITISPQEYQAKPFFIEADWSAASYYYAIAAFANECDLQLNGLFEKSVQGDSVLKEMMHHFGVVSTFNEKGVHLSKVDISKKAFIYDFLECPDLAQTLAVVCGGLGIKGQFTGLETLKIKETDRITALRNELAKINVAFTELPDGSCTVEQRAQMANATPQFSTYDDHRMAMSFAPLAMLIDVVMIENPNVVIKSYPDFWKDLMQLGFTIEF